ncbi:hypothetical protein [Glutamicibacter sp. M10]|uniref:hypothetical protein n=1 Tax=Glutamicibacter sp. M10 TaxID=3023076 RepID=UPI0021C76DBF|nr:hypothetical protein [Glutamicibacter sp. M10]UXN32694.1 hypothetical protein N6V40_04335 [Glutamicibacter sp. M10]
MRTYMIVIPSVIVAFAANVALDILTDIPMLLRWVLSIAAGLVVTHVLSTIANRRQRSINSDQTK